MRRVKSPTEKNFEAAKKALEKLQKEMGVDLGLDKIERKEGPNPHQVHADQHEVDAVLLSLHKPHAVKIKKCGYCGMAFGTTYCYVGYCTFYCRKKALEELGIMVYNSEKPTWGERVEPPVTIKPQTVLKMKEWATQILSQIEQLESQALESLSTLGEFEFEHAEEPPSKPEGSDIPPQLSNQEEHVVRANRLELLPIPDLDLSGV